MDGVGAPGFAYRRCATIDAMTGPRPDRPPRALLWTVLLGAVPTIAYWAFLGWDQHKDVDPGTGAQTGPYQVWQPLGLAAVVAALALTAGLRGRTRLAAVLVPAALTGSFSLDAATDAEADGLWPIGAALVAAGSLLGVLVVAGAGAYLRRRSPR